MSFAAIRFSEPIPIYNGMDYPYWKDKMMRNIISVDPAAWTIVKNGLHVEDLANPTEDEEKARSGCSSLGIHLKPCDPRAISSSEEHCLGKRSLRLS